ncbi:PQQ-dependent sugar dehydrogenase [Nisaea denitrificans]|uniref:PQQ-dependent sugar dehydrogenase n=1 Tax=Nisaea denitrificans TaxID=390877 RepID=UPI0003FB8B08|nr:PQQ-dependent sugar dehydrogenase [Nisaea denitrificans]
MGLDLCSRLLRVSSRLAANALLFGVAACAAGADVPQVERSDVHDFRVTQLAGGLDHPWGLAFLPDGRILVTEREGALRIVGPDGLEPVPVRGTPKVYASGQGGLLDVVLHPDFSENRLVYLSFAGRGDGGAGTEVARGRLVDDALVDLDVIFRQTPKVGGGRHFGSRLVFAPDGTLFVSMGDRGSYMSEAQNLGTHIGTIARIEDDGSVPPDNPFVGRSGALPEIYSYGHRNVQGMALRPGTSTIWAQEHGPRGGDEVNILRPGRNYGWPAITYGIDYSGAIISDKTAMPGMEQPVVYWVPSIAPSGMEFYDGDKFPNWRGNLFVGALAHMHLRRLVLDGDRVTEQEVLLEGLEERIRAVKQGPDGYLYVLTDSSAGDLLRLEPM